MNSPRREIAERAHGRWLGNGQPPGTQEQDWLKAEAAAAGDREGCAVAPRPWGAVGWCVRFQFFGRDAMPTTPQREQDRDNEQQKRGRLDALITEQVIGILGEPDDLREVRVRHLWDDHYRVNVFTGPTATSVKVAHSFFVVADNTGNIIASTPRIAKQY
jgi:Protein of unknown function (DUF2934)